MATTETRSGFRLPWTAAPEPEASTTTEETGVETTSDVPVSTTTDDVVASSPPETVEAPAAPAEPFAQAPRPSSEADTRRPTEFLAGLTRAMRSAAETEREQILERFRDDASGFVSEIRDRSAEHADELRDKADRDIEGIHEWSERELARIREETERRIDRRRTRLDEELAQSTARADQECDRVEAEVDAFGTRMATFFENLLAEEDPARFAAMAARLPEPPELESVAVTEAPAPVVPAAEPEPIGHMERAPDPEPSAQPAAAEPGGVDPWRGVTFAGPADGSPATAPEATVQPEPVEAAAPEAVVQPEAAEATAPEAGVQPEAWVQPEAAIQPEAGVQPEAEAERSDEPIVDPRVAALGLTPDFAAAEAEAAAAADVSGEGAGEPIQELADDAVAARLAGLTEAPAETSVSPSTKLVVTGLVSVASIAGFKRQVARIEGVTKVGVASGPDGEFVFTVTHAEGLDLREPITTLPGYGARVIGQDGDGLRIECRDPESAA